MPFVSRSEERDFREMPWRNGGGSTLELLIAPAGATLDSGFDWRLSMARVASSGPFSPFPGYDRSLMILDGGALDLDMGPQGLRRLEPLEGPLRFGGECPISATLAGRPLRDFNVITRRAWGDHRLRLMRDTVAPAAPISLVYLLEGRLDLACEAPLAGDPAPLEPGCLWRLERRGASEPPPRLLPAPGSAFLLAELLPAPAAP